MRKINVLLAHAKRLRVRGQNVPGVSAAPGKKLSL
jgi:hypothetical protein